jgi:hypothetical protein
MMAKGRERYHMIIAVLKALIQAVQEIHRFMKIWR